MMFHISNFFKAIKVKLPKKAIQIRVSEEFRQNLVNKALLIQYINKGALRIFFDDC
jgi:hypothetical protein